MKRAKPSEITWPEKPVPSGTVRTKAAVTTNAPIEAMVQPKNIFCRGSTPIIKMVRPAQASTISGRASIQFMVLQPREPCSAERGVMPFYQGRN